MQISSWKKCLAAAALLVCLPLLAWAEEARVTTPGGKLHMRKTAEDKGKIVTDVPNKAQVDVEEIGEEWSRITYKKKTGYVKTEYLKIPSRSVGKTLYADEGTLLLRAEPRGDAQILTPVGPLEAVAVTAAENGWLKVKFGETEGYVEAALLSFQLEKPAGKMTWVRQEGTMAAASALLLSLDQGAGKIADLNAGEKVTVTVIDGKNCLLITEQGCGYAPISAVCLMGPEDTGERTGSVAPTDAIEAAKAALKKAFKSFAKEKLYAQTAVQEASVYWCGFYNEQDQFVYGALVNADNKQTLLTASYAGFAVPVKESSLLPKGEMRLEISGEQVQVGDVVDITVHAWAGAQCAYTLTRDGTMVAATKQGGHFTAAFKPREAGEYTLSVSVTDGEGNKASAEKTFRAEGSKGASQMENVYSQKDGWWDDVKYRHSTMEQSGCAIFALAHALNRMGIVSDSAKPETLAQTYALCLTKDEGTNNERLITSAAKDFGFTTKRQLIKEQKEIVQLLRDGALFSFRVARGHIAMISGISEDGAMMRVVDSAPSATFERIINVSMYYQMRSGSFRAALSLDDLPGARWYLDTDEYGGLEYWMPVSYGAKLGVRLIKPAAQ